MNRKHAVVIALILGLATIVGVFALARTTNVGARAHATVSAAQISRQEAQLNRAEAVLRRQIAQAGAVTPAAPAAAAAVASAPQQQRVVYVRPKPHIITVHRAGGEHEQEQGQSRDGGGAQRDD